MGPDQILDVQERGALLTNVDERCLHPGKYSSHTAKHDVTDGAAVCHALNLKFGNYPFFDECDASFFEIYIYYYEVACHAPSKARIGAASGR
jgi:hypothetical protein